MANELKDHLSQLFKKKPREKENAIRVDDLIDPKKKSPKKYVRIFDLPKESEQNLLNKRPFRQKTADKTNDDIEINVKKNEVKDLDGSLADHEADIVIEPPPEARKVIICYAHCLYTRGEGHVCHQRSTRLLPHQ